mmetsp:Transcript_24415/g.35695  ORF Transcript_24415/g.35695 Transcript_24415/m.35695 type:complete len:307 (+) Transcript_24415:22-942(+)
MSAISLRQMLTTPAMKWAVGGWSFFIAENFILSENRTYLIQELGEDGYHYLYGSLSSAACGSILYGYVKKVRNAAPHAWSLGGRIPVNMRFASFLCHAVGLGMLSQIGPKLQIPIHASSSMDDEVRMQNNNQIHGPPPPSESNKKWKVRCPFDFADSKTNVNSETANNVAGLDRITRHPALWSFGLVGLGQALLIPSLPQRAWCTMPLFVALIGGWHTDSRHLRGMGGTLSSEMNAVTSNVPFLALLSGKQDGDAGVMESCRRLGTEMKPLNALLAVGASAVLVMRKGRGVSRVANGTKNLAMGFK